jgi:hypothetical protein
VWSFTSNPPTRLAEYRFGIRSVTAIKIHVYVFGI